MELTPININWRYIYRNDDCKTNIMNEATFECIGISGHYFTLKEMSSGNEYPVLLGSVAHQFLTVEQKGE